MYYLWYINSKMFFKNILKGRNVFHTMNAWIQISLRYFPIINIETERAA